jgi:hypothetical protein
MKNKESLIAASKKFGLKISTEETKYILLFRRQNARQSHDRKTANKLFENVAQFKYLGTTVTNQNLV